jgi:hypothetical protein
LFGLVMMVKLRILSPAGERQVSHNPAMHQSPILQRNRTGLLAGRGFLPFVKTVQGDQTAPLPERLAEDGLGVDFSARALMVEKPISI